MAVFEERPFSKSVQSLRKDELELLMSMISKRDLSQKVRDAIWLMFNHGYSLGMSSRLAGVSYRHVSNAEKKLIGMHDKIIETYVERHLDGSIKKSD
ncbi:hypothetical protein ABLB47_02925 [Vibrio parahaemolyticus]